AGRVAKREEIDEAIDAWTRERDTASVLESMDRAGVPARRVYTVADIVKDPQYIAREMIAHHTAFDNETVAVPAVVPKLSDTPGHVRVRAPMLGEHTDEVLRDLGFPEGQIARWREGGVIQ